MVALELKTQYQSIHFCFYRYIYIILSGRSAAWLARLPWEQEVVGSNPTAPTIYTQKANHLPSDWLFAFLDFLILSTY